MRNPGVSWTVARQNEGYKALSFQPSSLGVDRDIYRGNPASCNPLQRAEEANVPGSGIHNTPSVGS